MPHIWIEKSQLTGNSASISADIRDDGAQPPDRHFLTTTIDPAIGANDISGTFTLSVNLSNSELFSTYAFDKLETTKALDFDATAADIKAALQSLKLVLPLPSQCLSLR